MKMTDTTEKEVLRDFDREVYRSSLVSIFWAVISDRKKGGFKLRMLADALGRDKSVVSKWFSKLPNWEANTVSDIANALDVELRITARDRTNGRMYDVSGHLRPVLTGTSGPKIVDASTTPRLSATGLPVAKDTWLNREAA